MIAQGYIDSQVRLSGWLFNKCLYKLPYMGNGEWYCHPPIELLFFVIIFGVATAFILYIFYNLPNKK